MFAKSKLVADRLIKSRNPAPEAERSVAPVPLFDEAQAQAQGKAPLFEALQPQVKPSVISDAVRFVGDLISKGAIHIDGNAEGSVQAEAVTVGAGGSLNGKVSCGKLHVKGSFSGNAVCDDLIISDEANVTGSLTYKTLLVQRGAQVNGELFLVEVQ